MSTGKYYLLMNIILFKVSGLTSARTLTQGTVCCPISRHLDFAILYFVVKIIQIQTRCSKDIVTWLFVVCSFRNQATLHLLGKIQVFVEVSKICIPLIIAIFIARGSMSFELSGLFSHTS